MRWSKIIALAAVVAVVALAVAVSVAPVFKNYQYTQKYLPLIKEINLGLDLQGGVHVVLEAKDTDQVKVTPEAMKQLRAVIQNRVDQYGVAEPVIQQQGDRRLIIELAGIKDPEEAVNTMVKTAFLEFKDPSGKTVVTGKDLKDAQEAKDPMSGAAVVNLTFNDEGTKKFAQATTANVGKPIHIYLDGILLQSPVVKGPITGGRAEITGYESLQEAHRIAILLRSGALPVKVDVVKKRSVGPALGADSLAKSKHAGVVGVTAILVFMLIYYRLPGLVANFALIIYTLIVLAVYVGMHVTMTLPGIAGFLLSLGIAVDANVIIFERIKEELRSGKSLRSAIDAGFKRGFVAVFDANATTVLAALVLMFLGTGPIKGFAVTLIIGILASMFTAISMTRWLLHLVAAANIVKNPKYFGA
ncbi:MAG: protein translocase subunit SecD [Peptococcaceae bacterium]|nr:protein translocase subunit SecD [Peptococcaceae bacterium]